ncbi:hypothetical protein [Flavobacterium pectinovorum]|uniref:Lipoprotein n=1 Tax=Flavobacterium pectinovorum TaxID=29533 RepID=A0A502EY62_9FLAO|nr:hypothetical protein [Flavobacterium pectinovorum]TPG41964.1 hypothetical protein EAH81_06480 [Flavobacterium pectinovorum]
MKKIVFICISVILFSCKDQRSEKKVISYLIKAEKASLNNEIRGLIPEEYDSKSIITEAIDFDNDLKKDYICSVYDSKKGVNIEYWITSDYKLFLKNEFHESINYKFFVNLDNDNLMELFRASGEEDGIDYAFYDIKNNRLEPLLYFTPMLIDESKSNNYFFGYPWDILEIVISDNKLLMSATDNVERDGNIFIPKNQDFLPVLFFKGKTTQPEIKFDKKIKSEYVSLEKIIAIVKAKDNKHIKTIESLKSELGTYRIKKEVKCDLNKDGKEDLIIIFEPKEIKPLEEYGSSLMNSPLYVLINEGENKFSVSKNDNIIYTATYNCPNMGIKKLIVESNNISIEQGTCDKFDDLQNDNITFQYNIKTKSITLEKFKRDYFQRKDSSEMLPPSVMVSPKKFGKVLFEDYDSRKEYDK